MSERIERLTARSYQYGAQSGGFQNELRDALMGRALMEGAPEYAHCLRRARLDCAIFDGYPIEIDDDELLIGRYAVAHPLSAEERGWLAFYRDFARRNGRLGCHFQASTGHRVPDYELLLNVGVDGLLERIDRALKQIDFSQPEAAEKQAFYQASRLSLEGFARFADRAREALLRRAQEETSPTRRAEYLRMAENFSRAPRRPCEHFYEALQCMWFLQFSLHLIGDTGLTGRLDRYLYPFYQKDMQDGTLTKDFAFELLESLYLKHNEIYGSWPGAIMVGGVSADGQPVWNELSDMCIDAVRTVRLVNPAVSVCYTLDMPDALIEKCVRLIADGYTRPAFFNDRVIREGLQQAGVEAADACNYIHSTCVEITPIGASAIQVATPYINLNKVMEFLFGHGEQLFGAPCGIAREQAVALDTLLTFDDFWAAACGLVRSLVRAALEQTCRDLYALTRYASSPLASAFLHDCIERGKDCGAGGAKYSFAYPCFPGFVNLVDSLAAVRAAVYERRELTLAELGELLRGNFEGREPMRQYLLHRCPKFGNGDDAVDALAQSLYDLLRDALAKYRTPLGSTFHPSYFAWMLHGRLGAESAATADGRREAEALSECLGPAQGMDRNGPGGILRSVAKLDQRVGIGGIATNLRFTQRLMRTPEGVRAVASYIRAFMARDCFELQFNVVDQRTLLAAQEHPDEYRTLMVRVAGFSDYFVNLSPVIQREIIRRNEHDSV